MHLLKCRSRVLALILKLQLEAERLSAALNAGQAIILSVGIAAVMAMTGLKVARGLTTVGDLVLANGLILQLSGPLQVLSLVTIVCLPVL